MIEKSSRYTFTFAIVSQRLRLTSASRAVCDGIVPMVPVTWNHVLIGGLLRLTTFGLVLPSLTATATYRSLNRACSPIPSTTSDD